MQLESLRGRYVSIGICERPHGREARKKIQACVLEKGGAQDEMKTLVDFLGGEPKPDAFYRNLGVA